LHGPVAGVTCVMGCKMMDLHARPT